MYFAHKEGAKMTTLGLDLDVMLKILLACFLGGLIGLERESINRPAGLRTHILVCVGSTLVMTLNTVLVTTYSTTVNIDPGRFGAAVLSGIGFLGAGTIIREGNSVSGLTTAASLWTIACIGITIGAGHFLLATYTTLIVLFVLFGFAYFEKKVTFGSKCKAFTIEIENRPGQLGKIGEVTGKHDCIVQNIKLEHLNDFNSIIALSLKYPKNFNSLNFIADLNAIDGISRIDEMNTLNG